MKRSNLPVLFSFLFLAVLYSCSTTRSLPEDKYRLAKNTIKVTNDKHFNTGQLDSYLKQKSNSYLLFGWNPFLNLYNTGSGKGDIWDKFVKKVGDAPVVFDQDLVEQSRSNLLKHLEYLGYYGSSVDTQIQTVRKLAKVNYIITLGKTFPIGGIKMNVPPGEFEETFTLDTANISIRTGDILSEARLEAETARGSKFMRNNGFYGFDKNYYSFVADTVSHPDTAFLTMNIENHSRNEKEKNSKPLNKYYFGNVDITLPTSLRFNDKILSNLNCIKPGDMYCEDNVNRTYSRLSSLRVFSSVNVELTPVSKDTVDCHIKLSESKLQGFKTELEASSNSSGLFGFSPQISYYHKNIFGGAQWLNLGLMGNFQFKFDDKKTKSTEFGLSADLNLPDAIFIPKKWIWTTLPRADFKLSYNYQDRPEYTRNIISTSYGYLGASGERVVYQIFPIQLNIVRLFNIDENFYKSLVSDPFLRNAYQNHFNLGAGGSYLYSTTTETNPKTSFFYTSVQLDIAGNLLSLFKGMMQKDSTGSALLWNTPYSQYVRGEVSVGKTWRFGRNDRQALATRFLIGAGYAYGNSTALPFEQHFYAGGSSSMRGWQARTVGPGFSPIEKSFVIPNQTGDMKLEANLEYRFGLFWKLDGALFLDVGNIWTLKDDNPESLSKFRFNTFFRSLAADWGTGIRVDLNFIVLRVDAGFKIHEPCRENMWLKPGEWFQKDGFAIHFGVGYPF